MLLSPIINLESSPLYFKSWGIEPIEEKGKNLLFFPISVLPVTWTFEISSVPYSIVTFSSIIQYGPTLTLLDNLAFEEIIAVLWITLS